MGRKVELRDVLGLTILLIVLAMALMRLASGAYSTLTIFILIATPLLLIRQVWVMWPRRRLKDDDTPPIVSIVMLLREHRHFDTDMLRPIVERAWGVTLEDDDLAECSLVGKGRHFVIKAPTGVFVVHNVETPYVHDPAGVAESISELRTARALAEHKAWMAVDLITPVSTRSEGSPYHAIGKVIAELADDNCILLYSPALGRAVPYEGQLREQLRGDDPLKAICTLIHVPVVGIAPDDPRMKAAVEQAHRRWPEFVAAFEKRGVDQMFSVKGQFGEEDNPEFMWINVSAIENDTIYGELGNDPVCIPSLREGDRVRIQLADLNDWLYTSGDDMIGGFTVKILRDQLG